MQEVLRVERLVPEARSAEEPNGRPGTGQLGIPAPKARQRKSHLSQGLPSNWLNTKKLTKSKKMSKRHSPCGQVD